MSRLVRDQAVGRDLGRLVESIPVRYTTEIAMTRLAEVYREATETAA